MKTISYYDLLNMVKNNEYPSVYYNYSNRAKTLYVPDFDDVDNSFLCYILKNNKEYNEEYARHYLVENILESEMFENNLEIIEDTPEEIYFDEEDIKAEKEEMKKLSIEKKDNFYDYYKEDKKIEKLRIIKELDVINVWNASNCDIELATKINEIIDKVNGE